ncbi:hypothetical protein AJ79_04026 [Helicocarpus griseus UAMH5409]|uniref:Uncharacterized protein n=1 Tax=Helicocarpus griseus UAMH5409 TaxID=1447875 RepID=A0A2B7XVZ9_9EURO|nr:hypothetical protein AJ79_04026 [Helicocarpus griseus UAMH5409]
MSDTEGEWKPNGRPQSTMALSLAAALDDAFMLDSEVDHLSNSVTYKQHLVKIQNRELEALEAKIRETERRLKARGSRVVSQEEASELKNSMNRRQGMVAGMSSSGENKDKGHGQSPLSSPTSDSHQSDEGFTDASTSAATSTDADDRANYEHPNGEAQQKDKGIDRNS